MYLLCTAYLQPNKNQLKFLDMIHFINNVIAGTDNKKRNNPDIFPLQPDNIFYNRKIF